MERGAWPQTQKEMWNITHSEYISQFQLNAAFILLLVDTLQNHDMGPIRKYTVQSKLFILPLQLEIDYHWKLTITKTTLKLGMIP